eukprot:COSAG01_NODE_53928_length_335_cov_3.741525_1_plen_38_part_10
MQLRWCDDDDDRPRAAAARHGRSIDGTISQAAGMQSWI